MNRKYQKQSYKTLFSLLESFYNETKNDSVGILLGSMDSEPFDGSDSADPAAFEDFCDCLNDCYKNTSTENIQTAFLAAKQFLKFYKNEFGFNLSDVEEYIDYKKFEEEFVKLI